MPEVEWSEKERAFAEELSKYEQQWVAILRSGEEETIVGNGKSIREARLVAEGKGFKEVVFLKVPSSHVAFIPSAGLLL